MAEQEPQGAFRNVEPLLRPQSITIVGASERPDSWSARIYRNLRSYGFSGEIYLVNPRHQELYGAPCFPSVTAVPGKVDQLVVIVPARQLPDVIEEGGKRGYRSAVVFSGGFSETNTPAGMEAEREMVAAAERYGILICGPNCLGNISTREHVLTLAEQGVEHFGAGGLALISQSSGLMGGLARYANSRGIGLSYGIASGSEANVDAADYLDFLVEDESTRVIGLILEAIRRPGDFALACQRARAVQKPILVLKIGRSQRGQEAAFTHTGALAGSYEAFKAFCRRHGLIEVSGLDEMTDTAELFLRSRLPTAGGVAAIALSGGARGHLHDLEEELGIDFPPPAQEVQGKLEQLLGVGAGIGNPLDLGAAGASDPQAYLQALDLLARQPSIGLIAVQGELPHGPEFAARAEGFQKMAARAAELGKPVVFFSRASYTVSAYGARFRELCAAPFLQDIRKSFQAIRHVMSFRNRLEAKRLQPRQRNETEQNQRPILTSRILESTVALSDAEAFGLLEKAAIPIARYEITDTADGAKAAAQRLGYPVALKASVPGLTHKSETGGVWLGLSGPGKVAQAFDSIQSMALPSEKKPVLVLVQEMIQGPMELYIGSRWDPEFGPLVTCGLGGLFVEAMGRFACCLAPVTIAEAEEMLEESGVSRALRRLRVEQTASRARIVDTILKLSRLVARHREILTLEINPLVLKASDGLCVAVDVVALRRD